MVVFENVLSHTSTQKSPKYLNLHNLSAEFYLGKFLLAKMSLVWRQGGWHKLLGDGFASFCGLMWFSKQWPKGPSPQGACGSDLPLVLCHLLVIACTPYFLNKPQMCQPAALFRPHEFPILAWALAVCVDVLKPSGLHSFCPTV